MSIATHQEILGMFPGIQDHAAVEILEMKATIAELEAAIALLSGDERVLVEFIRREGGQIHRLLDILNQAGVDAGPERDT